MADHLQNKINVHQGLKRVSAAPASALRQCLADIYHPEARWCGSHPVNEQHGLDAIEAVWAGLKSAMPDMERRDAIVVAGPHEESDYVGALGHYQATFTADWLGIPATHGVVHLRYGELHIVRDGKLWQTYAMLDVLDLMRQAGVWPLQQSLGREGMWPGPVNSDGLRLSDYDGEQGAASVAVMQAMHKGLLDFDGVSLESMTHRQYWKDNFMWYGPSGIGTTRGIRGFEANHQIPFLRAFPDRDMGGEYICFGDGPYAATGGWPAMALTHTGPGWLGLPPSGRAITLRVMDFYRIEDGLIAENWVPIDILNALDQLGMDVFARLRHQRGEPRRSL